MVTRFTAHAVNPCHGRTDDDGVFHGYVTVVTGMVIGTTVYVVTSLNNNGHYFLVLKNEEMWKFLCGCCNASYPEVQAAITEVVKQAKAAGATKVIYRKPVGKKILGLPIEDVSKHVGDMDEFRIFYDR